MMNKTHNGLKILAIMMAFIVLTVTVLGLVFIDNKNVEYEYFEVASQTVKKSEIKIAHLSDLHFPKIKVDTGKMADQLLDENPDLIAITGDLIDGGVTVESCGVIAFLDQIKEIAPIFFVYGNHEVSNYKNTHQLNDVLKARGVTILENESVNVTIDGVEVTLIGLSDNADYDKKYLAKNANAKANYKMLLAHRPEKWRNYTSQEDDFKPNLVLTGHAHGGQFRFFNQGLVAPDQGFFPEYDSGIYKTADESCAMVVSRGIGNSILPFRFNNKPHVPIITIQ